MVVAIGVVVRHTLSDHVPKMLLAEEDHSIKAFGFDRSHETLRVGIQVWAFRRKLDATHAGRRERLCELRCVQRIAIVDEVMLPEEETVKAVRQIPCHLIHP